MDISLLCELCAAIDCCYCVFIFSLYSGGKYIYTSTLLKYNFELLKLRLSISATLYFYSATFQREIHFLHYIYLMLSELTVAFFLFETSTDCTK